MDAPTSAHILALPSILAFSPELSALHATRARSLHPSLLPSLGRCTRCGTELSGRTDGIYTHRVYDPPSCASASIRGSNGPQGKRRRIEVPLSSQKKPCRACGHLNSVVVDQEAQRNARASFPSARRVAAMRTYTGIASATNAPKNALDIMPLLVNQPSIASPKSASKVMTSNDETNRSSPKNYSLPPGLSTLPAPTLTTPSTKELFVSRLDSQANAAIPDRKDTKQKTRPKKKTGLQTMLERNREKQRTEEASTASGGLAAFLSGIN